LNYGPNKLAIHVLVLNQVSRGDVGQGKAQTVMHGFILPRVERSPWV